MYSSRLPSFRLLWLWLIVVNIPAQNSNAANRVWIRELGTRIQTGGDIPHGWKVIRNVVTTFGPVQTDFYANVHKWSRRLAKNKAAVFALGMPSQIEGYDPSILEGLGKLPEIKEAEEVLFVVCWSASQLKLPSGKLDPSIIERAEQLWGKPTIGIIHPVNTANLLPIKVGVNYGRNYRFSRAITTRFATKLESVTWRDALNQYRTLPSDARLWMKGKRRQSTLEIWNGFFEFPEPLLLPSRQSPVPELLKIGA